MSGAAVSRGSREQEWEDLRRRYLRPRADRPATSARGVHHVALLSQDVERTIRLVDLAEYKRRQAPPGIKISVRAFGRDRRMPITNRYRG